MQPILNSLDAWLSTDAGAAAYFGFFAALLFLAWRKATKQWSNSVVVKWLVRIFGVYVAYRGLIALQSNMFDQPNIYYALLSGGVVPLLSVVGEKLRRKEKVRRGAKVGGPADVNKQTASTLPRSEFEDSFEIGGVTIPRAAEPYHFFVVGSTGSGKSVAITNLIDHLEARGDIALVVDSGGEFCSRYYNPKRGDRIINPFDDRCAPWSPTAEMAGPWDAEALAKSMVPDGTGESKEWNSYAQTLVTSVLRQLHAKGRLSIKDLLYFVQAAPVEELGPLLAGTPAAAQLGSDKTFASIRTIAANYLGTYAYLSDNDDPFSVSKFIRAEKPGFLFMTYRDDQLDSLRNMISCVLDVAARTILAMPASPTRRVWLIIDEFASIGKVQSIEAMATKARKMGGCLLLGLQSVSQLQDKYGEKAAQTILSCLSSWLVLRCSDAETSDYVSKYIGESEISRMTRGESSSDTGGSDSLNEQIQTQRAIMPVELQRLANLQGFFKLAGDYAICNIKLKFPKKRAPAAVNYADRDFYAKPMLDLNTVNTGATTSAPATGVAVTLTARAPAADPAPMVVELTSSDVAEAPASAPKTYKLRRSPLLNGPSELFETLNALAEEAAIGEPETAF